MLPQQRLERFFEMTEDSIITKIINKISIIIEKIKTFIKEKVFKKENEIPDVIEIDSGVFNKIKEAMKICSNFISKGTEKGLEFVKNHKLPITLTALFGIVAFTDYQNSKTYKIAKTEYTRTINECQNELDKIEAISKKLESKGKMTSKKRNELKKMRLEVLTMKKGQEDMLASFPEYLNILEKITIIFHKIVNTLSSFIHKKGATV